MIFIFSYDSLSYLALYLRDSFSELDVVGVGELRVNADGLTLPPALFILVLQTTQHIQTDVSSNQQLLFLVL